MKLARSLRRSIKTHGGNTIPRTNLKMYIKAPGMVDSKGLSTGPVQPGYSLLFSGAQKITTPTLTLVGNFEIRWRQKADRASSSGAVRAILGYNAAGSYIGFNSTLSYSCAVAGLGTQVFSKDDTGEHYILVRVGSVLTLTVDGVAQSLSCNTGNLVLNLVGASQVGNYFGGDIWDIEVFNASGTLVLSIPGVPPISEDFVRVPSYPLGCVVTGATAAFYTKNYDGATGKDVNIAGFSDRHNLIVYSENLNGWDKTGTIVITEAGDYKSLSITTGNIQDYTTAIFGYTANDFGIGDFSSLAISPIPRRRLFTASDSKGNQFYFAMTAYEAADGDAENGEIKTIISERTAGTVSHAFQATGETKLLIKNIQLTIVDQSKIPVLGTVVCVGDSISTVYPTHLARLFTASTIVNASVSGDTIDDVIERFAADVAAESPDEILLLIGTNNLQSNTLEEIQTLYLSLLALCDATGARVTLGNLLPMGQSGSWSTALEDKLQQVNLWLATIGRRLVDQYSDYLEPGTTDLMHNYTSDGLHPTVANAANYLAENFAISLGWEYPNFVGTNGYSVTGLQPAVTSTTDMHGNSLQYPGPVKKSLKQVGADLYEWQPDPQLLAVIGVDNACFGADGTAVQFATPALALAALASLADDTYLFGGTKGAALYSVDKSAKAALIKKYLADVD